MKRTIEYFEKPECTVSFKNIIINKDDFTFSLELGTKEGRQKKFRWQIITGKVHTELMEYFTKLVDEKVPVQNDQGGIDYIKTGKKMTPFQIFCSKNGIEYKRGILPELKFACDNKSDDYAACPFKVVVHKNGATLTLVNIASKKLVQYRNPNTGEVSTKYVNPTYIDKDGNRRRSWTGKDYYVRYIYHTTKEVEVATPEQIEQAQQS